MSAELKDIMTGFYVKLNPFSPKEMIPPIAVPGGLLAASDIIIIHVDL